MWLLNLRKNKTSKINWGSRLSSVSYYNKAHLSSVKVTLWLKQ